MSGQDTAILSTNCKLQVQCQTLPVNWNKQAVLVVSQLLSPDVVFILLPVFGLQTNHSFKALMIICNQAWLHPSRLTFTMIWKILSAEKETESKETLTLKLCFTIKGGPQMTGWGSQIHWRCKISGMSSWWQVAFSWNSLSYHCLSSGLGWGLCLKQSDLDDVVVAIFSMDSLDCTDV